MSRPKKRYDVAAVGSMVVDWVQGVPRILNPEEKVLIDDTSSAENGTARLGGVVLNQLGWARVLGLQVTVFGKQADDTNGRFLRSGMEQFGIARNLDLSGSRSSVAHVYVTPDGERAIYMKRGATGELTPVEIEGQHRAVLENAHWVSSEISQLPLAVVRRVFELARKGGAKTVIDIDVAFADAVPRLGSEEDLWASLRTADLVKGSRAALASSIPARDAHEAIEELGFRFEAPLTVLTLGAAGALLRQADGIIEIPACAIEPIDTTGAGDAFTGGMLAGLQGGLEPVDAVRLGNACGATCCEQLGGFPLALESCRERVLERYHELGGARFIPAPIEAVGGSTGGSTGALDSFFETTVHELERVGESTNRMRLREVARLIRGVEQQGGRVHVTGVGKPEHVARYVAALLSSTGTPAVFLHATEAAHGGVGQVRPGDVVIAISNSGRTEELLDCVRALRGFETHIIAVTGDPGSPLARVADLTLTVRVENEGGPLGLAPRASVLAETFVLAALSVELQATRDFGRADYHRRHPGGTLGLHSHEPSHD